MSEFIYPSDIDLAYATLDTDNRKLQNKYIELIKSINPRKGNNVMVNELKFNLSSTGDYQLITTADPNNEPVSQFQEVMIRVKLDPSFYEKTYTGFVVILHISEPSPDVPSSINDFNYHFHLVPDLYEKGWFYLRLSDVFNRYLKIGILNECKFRFQVLAKVKTSWDSYDVVSNNTLGLYKTNLEMSSNPNDLSNAFMAINDINYVIDNITK